MGILSRFSEIMKSNINALLDKAEDPAKMVDQTLRELREDLAEVKKETASVMADEKRAARQVEECQKDIDKMRTAAENALKSGNEEDAKKLISQKQNLEAKLVSLQETYEVSRQNADKMRQLHDKLVQDIDSLEARKDAVKAKVATAKAQQHMNKMASGVNTASSMEAFNRMEAKADKMLDAANAEAELNAGANTADELANKYVSGSSAQVDDELARMKAELGI